MILNPILLAFIATAGAETAVELDDEKIAEYAGVPLDDVKAWRASLQPADTAQTVQVPDEVKAPKPPRRRPPAEPAPPEPPPVNVIRPPLSGLLWRVLLMACSRPTGRGNVAHPTAEELPALLEVLAVDAPAVESDYLEDKLVELRKALWTTEPALVRLRELLENGTNSMARLETMAEAAGLKLSQALIGQGIEASMDWLSDFAFGVHERDAKRKPDAPVGTFWTPAGERRLPDAMPSASQAPPAQPAPLPSSGEFARNVKVKTNFFVQHGHDGRYAVYNLGDVFGGDLARWLQVNHPTKVEPYPRVR